MVTEINRNTATLKGLEEDEYEEELNQIYGTVEICGQTFDQGTAYRELDPTGFRCGMGDELDKWTCDGCGTIWDDETEAIECCDSEEWQCDKCETVYDDETEAELCCVEDEE